MKDEVLREMVMIYQEIIQRRADRASRESGGIDPWLFESTMTEKVWRALDKWKIEGRATFYTYIRRTHELAIIDVIRSQRKEINDHRNEIYAEDISEDNFASDMDLDRELIRKDQLQLVSDLVRGSGKNAPKVEPIVNVFLNGDVTSLQDVGDVLGESKQTVSNRLKSLRKVFGEHDFGMISDYYVA